MTARSSSIPAPVRAETTTAPGSWRCAAWRCASAAGPIGLVEHDQLGHVAGADVGQHGADGADLTDRVGIGRVDHVHQQVGLGRLLQRRGERLDQVVRQVPDEADGVGQRVDPAVVVCARRVVGSRVANSASSTSTPAPVSRFSRLDLPALV